MFRNRLKLNFFNNINSRSIQVFVKEHLQLSLESVESHHYAGDVVYCSPECAGSKDSIYAMPAVLVGMVENHLLYLFLVRLHDDLLPGDVNRILRGELVKDAVAADDDEVMIVFDLKGCHVWISDDYFGVSLVLLQLSFDVTNCSGNRESAREHAMWSIDELLACFSH